MINKLLVQGDVFLIHVGNVPQGAIKKEKTKRGYILAEGETTGHAHIINDNVEMYEKDGTLYIKTDKKAAVKHEEHQPITVAKGIWKVGIVREFDAFEQESRNVRD